MASTVDTSVTALATAFCNQRKLLRLSNGRLWACYDNGLDVIEFEYSDDGGVTFTPGASSVAGTKPSWRADESDHVHLVYHSSPASDILYRQGIVDAVSNEWDWSSPLGIANGSTFGAPDVCVFQRTSDRWYVHVFFGFTAGGLVSYLKHVILDVLGIGGSFTPITPTGGDVIWTGSVAGHAPSPSCDFFHTGDGKTIQGGSPHLFVGFSGGTVNPYVRMKKAVHSAGSWTWQTDRTIHATNYALGERISARFDGQAFVTAFVPSGASTTVEVWERDAADTGFTQRVVPALSDGAILGLSLTTDGDRDIHLAAIGTTSTDPSITRYTRDVDTWDSWAAIEATTARTDSITFMPGYDTHARLLYTAGTGPYDVRYADVSLNHPPNTAPWVNVDNQAADVASALTVDWVFDDPDPGDTQSAYALKRDIAGTIRWWDGTDWDAVAETYVTSAVSAVTLPAGWGADTDATHKYYVRTKDAGTPALEAAAYSPALNVIPSAKDNPTITSGATETTAMRTLTATVATITAYRARLYEGSTLLEDSGVVPSANVNISHPFSALLTDTVSYTEELTTLNDEGLASTAATNNFVADFVEPATPFLVATPDAAPETVGAITVDISNPAPVGAEPALAYNDLWRREGTDDTTAIRIATGAPASFVDWSPRSGVAYQYQVRAFGVNGAVALSAWTS